MNPMLQGALKIAGWRSGVRRGSLATNRAGIEFEIAEERGTDGRLELRYRYHTATTQADGEVSLPADADRATIEDMMTGIYLRIHERPDPSRVFGGGKTVPGDKRSGRIQNPIENKNLNGPRPTQGELDL